MEQRVEVVEAKVADLVALGAGVERRTRHDEADDAYYVTVMHDPEGNEFCIS
ncbi:MAG TPA: VOC family protein [Actinomycetes bacterium]|nr:VOC family protein [Actinomycetes bacterium]